MKPNNFKALQKEQLDRMPNAPQRVEDSIDSSIGFIQVVSNVLELYLPRVFDVLVTMSGGKVKHEKDGVPPSTIDPSKFTDDSGPSKPPHELS